MRALLRGRDLSGFPVVDLSTGEDIAEIRDVIFDQSHGTIGGFTLAKRGLFGKRLKELLTVDAVHSVGTHAVTVDTGDAISDPADAPPQVAEVDPSADVTDDLVVTESGRQLGKVRDVIIQGGPRPTVVGFEISGGAAGDGFVPIGEHTAVSGTTLIVPDDFENRIRTDLVGFATEVAATGRTS